MGLITSEMILATSELAEPANVEARKHRQAQGIRRGTGTKLDLASEQNCRR